MEYLSQVKVREASERAGTFIDSHVHMLVLPFSRNIVTNPTQKLPLTRDWERPKLSGHRIQHTWYIFHMFIVCVTL